MQAIVVTFDRLATRLLGCYGNEWVETPNFDLLATTSTVFDEHFVDTVGPHRGHAWLTGRHALWGTGAITAPGELLRAAGVTTRAVVSENGLVSGFSNAEFDQCQSVGGTDGLDSSPNDVPFAKLVQAAGAVLKEESFNTEKRLLWLHAPEPGLPPEGFATLYFEDFEERDAPVKDVPREDWDRQLAVAAGSVSLVDHWLGVLLQDVAASNRPTLIIVAAAGGRAWMDDFIATSPSIKTDSPVGKLRDQEIKSPLILAVRNDDRSRLLTSLRSQQFVQPMDILPTLLDWFGQTDAVARCPGTSLLQVPLLAQDLRNATVYGDEDRTFGIRTRQWGCLARVSDPTKPFVTGDSIDEGDWPEQVQLFIKPDDIWDVTDISSQYPEVCHRLLMQIDDMLRGSADAGKVVGECVN